MPESNTIASALISVKLDLSEVKKQIGQLKSTLSQITNVNSKITNTTLKEEAKRRKEILKTEKDRLDVLKKISAFSSKMALGGIGAVGFGLREYLKTTDIGARRLNGALLRVKNSFSQLLANVGKQANIKFGLTEKLEKLSKFINNISKADINKFLDNAKMAIFIAGFAKMLLIVQKLVAFFEKMSGINAASRATTPLASGLGAGIGAGIGSKVGLGTASLFKMNAVIGFLQAKFSLLGYQIYKISQRLGPALAMLRNPLSILGQKMAVSGASGVAGTYGRLGGMAGSSKIMPSGSLLGAPSPAVAVPKAGIGGMGAAIVAFLAVGAAARALGKDGLDPLAKAMDGLNKIMNFFTRIILSLIEILGFFTDTLSDLFTPIFNILFAIIEAFKGNFQTAADNIGSAMENIVDNITGKNLVNNVEKSWKNLKDIWNNPIGGQDKMAFNGGSTSGGFADLNKMFQQMFETNLQQGLINASINQTQATQANTAALNALTGKIMTPEQSVATASPSIASSYSASPVSVYGSNGFGGYQAGQNAPSTQINFGSP